MRGVAEREGAVNVENIRRVVTPSMACVYPRKGRSNGNLMERRAIEMIASSMHARMISWGVTGAMFLLLCVLHGISHCAVRQTRVPANLVGYTPFNAAHSTQFARERDNDECQQMG
jgi:hypothetical protein